MDGVWPEQTGSLPARPVAPAAGPVVLLSEPFTEAAITVLRHRIRAAVTAVGLTGDEANDFVLAVHELVTNAVRHGGGSGLVELRRSGGLLTCEVSDHGAGTDQLPVRMPAPDVPGGRGLWLAHQLTGTLMLTSLPGGVNASVSACLTASPAVAEPAAGPAREPGDAERG